MLWYEVKDTVREHLARTTFPTDMLDKSLANGRRIVEQAGNWYWMRLETFFTTQINQPVYPIYSQIETPSGGIPPQEVLIFNPNLASTNAAVDTATIKIPEKIKVQPVWIPGYKDSRAALVKEKTDNSWSPCGIGQITKSEMDQHYAINDNGITQCILVENFNLYVYPPFPDKEYLIYLYYFGWTANPKSNLATDELVERFPDALIYASLCWAYELELKDMEGAAYWRKLLGGQPDQVGIGGEIAKIRRHNFQRMRQDNMSLTPLTGPMQRVNRLNMQQPIWLGSNWNW